MTLSRRTLLTGIGGLAAAATVTACGSNTGGIGTSTAPSASATGPLPELTQWYHEYGEAGTQDAVKKYAAAYDKAKVTVKWNPGDYGKLLAAALLTNDVPDVFEAEMGASVDMIKAGQVADLTDVMADSMAKFNPAVLERMMYQDKLYAIPQVIDMHLLYYRPSLLAKANITEPPATFEALVDAATKMKTADMGGFFTGNDGMGPMPTVLMLASGFNQLDESRTKAGFLDPAFYDALISYRDFFNSGALLQSASKEWYDGSPFINEETAMQWGGLWSMTDVQAAFGDDFGVIPFPAIGASGRKATIFGAFGSCVATKGKNVEAAKAFAKWLWVDQTSFQVEFANAFGTHVPAQPTLTPQASKLASGPGADAAKMIVEHGFPGSEMLWTGALGDAFTTAVTNVIKKKADPEKEFASVGEKAIAELKRVNG
ncbi:MAG TPA: extracellular solute-binding protein [Propionibacteriaceae bacterium]|nr:extracellular solute-binding protein [Propionibacteriaceae bacterium]